jgi:hypothetical protein
MGLIIIIILNLLDIIAKASGLLKDKKKTDLEIKLETELEPELELELELELETVTELVTELLIQVNIFI